MKHLANVIGGTVYIQRNEVGGTIATRVCKKNPSRRSPTRFPLRDFESPFRCPTESVC